jgi:soluble cytochrome b562
MAGIETKVGFRLDARGLKDARRELEKTFKPVAVRELNAALKDTRGSLKALASEQARLTVAMLGVDKGTDAFKKLGDELERVSGRYREIARAQSALQAAGRQAPGAGGFTQGFLQSLSPTAGAFLQRGPGMKAQFAGQVAGGMVRRAGGASSAMAGGQGPLTTAFGNIPFIGGPAALAEANVDRAADLQRAQLEAYSVTGGAAGRRRREAQTPAATLDKAGNAAVDAYRAGQGAAATKLRAAGQTRTKEATPEEMVEYKITPPGIRPEVYAGMNSAQQLEAWQRAEPRMRREATREQVKGERAAEEQGRAGARRTTGRASGFEGVSAGLMTRQEELRAGVEFTRGVGGQAVKGQFQQAMAAQTLYGVDAGTAAQLMRAQRPGRGGTSGLGKELLPSTIADAMAQGLEGSEIGEQLAHIASLQEQAAQQGIKIQTESLQGVAVGLTKGMGLEGPRGMTVAGQIGAMGTRVAQSGAQSGMDIALLRAAGYSPEKGNYISSLKKVESFKTGGMDVNTMFDFLQNMTGGATGEQAEFSLQRGLKAAGVDIGLGTEAPGIVEALAKGKGAFADLVGESGKKGAKGKPLFKTNAAGGIEFVPGTERGAGSAADMGREFAAAAKDMGGIIRAQNAVANTLTGAGAKAAEEVTKMQKAASTLASDISTISKDFKPVTDAIVKFTGDFGRFVKMIDSGQVDLSGGR